LRGKANPKLALFRALTTRGIECKPGDTIVRVDPRYYRPTEVETLLGDPTKAREKLGWTPKIKPARTDPHEMVALPTTPKPDAMRW
jgi:GDPmannose 4,6-dehydratase